MEGLCPCFSHHCCIDFCYNIALGNSKVNDFSLDENFGVLAEEIKKRMKNKSLKKSDEHSKAEDQYQTEELEENLLNKVTFKLKPLVIEMRSVIMDEHKNLNEIENKFESTSAKLLRNINHVVGLGKSGSIHHLLYLFLFILFVIFVLWCLIK